MSESLFDISLDWATDIDGYRIVPTIEHPNSAPIGLTPAGIRIVRNGGKLRPVQPSKIHRLLEQFMRVRTPAELLNFVGRAGPLTHQGLYSEKAEGLPDRDGRYCAYDEEGDDLFDLLEEADWFRELVKVKTKPKQVVQKIERQLAGLSHTARIIPDPKRGLRIVFFPNDLLELLRLQFLHAMLGSKSLVTCPMCGNFFERGVGTERRGDALFCCDGHRIKFNSQRRTNGSPAIMKVRKGP